MRVAAIAILLVTGMARRCAGRAPPRTTRPPPRRAAAPAPEAQPAAAPPATEPDRPASRRPPKQFPKLRQASLLHKYQLGIAMMPGVGYRGIFPYAGTNDQMINCGQQGKRVCTGMLPFFLDVQPSFGFAEHWDVLSTCGSASAPTSRRRTSSRSRPASATGSIPSWGSSSTRPSRAAFDATAQHNPLVKDNDFGVRNANGFMFEVMRNLGFYIQLGETLGFVRWLRFEIDGGVGVQARIP